MYETKNSLQYPTTCPRQKLSTREKTEEAWGIPNLLYWEHKLITGNSSIESDRIRMKKNANLYFNNILDPTDVANIVNPHDIQNFVMPLDFKHYKIENPKIQTLKGEELKRRFEWKVYVSNRDAVSKKEKQKQEQFAQFVTEKIKDESFDQKEAESQLQKLQEYLAYDWQDVREQTADQLLHYYTQYLDLKTEYSKAWENGLLYGHEIMSIDEHNLKPVVESCDPKTIFWLRSPENPYIDNSDCIIREYYIPLGQVIDYYYDYLTSSQISDLEERIDKKSIENNFTFNQFYSKDEKGFLIPNATSGANGLNPSLLNVNDYNFNGYYDSHGNIRVVHTRWKSFRKIGVLSSFDDEGNPVESFVDENYRPFKSKGETVRWIWITEAWEGTRIGEDVFIKIQPRSIQYRKLDNISACSLGYVGTSIANNVFDLIKEYSIKYDAYMHRTEQAMIKAIGKIGILDLSLIPDGWNVDMWLHFATNMGWAVKDSFKEGKKGAAMGKLAGSNNTNADVINLEQGVFIQQNMAMLQYLEGQMDSLIGINKQRQGAVNASAGLQVTREAVDNSSTITESYFSLHDNVKLRTLRMLLEVAKYCLRGKSESLQYVTSEFTNEIFNVDGDLINEAEYDLLVGNATNDKATIDVLQEAVKIALQTGAVDLIQLMDIFSSNSTAAIKRKVDKSVRAKQEQEQKNIEATNEQAKAAMEQQAQMQREILDDKDLDRELAKYKIDTEAATKIQIQELANYFQMTEVDADNSGVPDAAEIANNALYQQEINSKSFLEQQKISSDKDKHSKDLDHKKSELKAKVDIENKKIEAIKVQNASQEKLAKEKGKLDRDMMDKKMKIESIKAKAAIAKSKIKPKATKK